MSRGLSSSTNAEIVKTITTPYFLIDIMTSIPLYYSTRNIVEYNSNSYNTDRAMVVGGIKYSKNGSASSSITISNLDNALSTLFLLTNAEVDVLIRKTYSSDSVIAINDATLLFQGSTNGFSIDKAKITLSVASFDLVKFSPGIIISKKDFSYLPAKGTVINSGNATIILN